ncbi:hypothetical protein K435DRAFT_682988, partial [Dendrothele bispora CBS 962.96]
EKLLEVLELNEKFKVVLVRKKEDLGECDGLVIPGGELRTIALLGVLARHSGLLDPLKEFIKTKDVWGTCAGAFLLSKTVVGTKRSGQELLSGTNVTIARNGWGRQVRSFSCSSMSLEGRPEA